MRGLAQSRGTHRFSNTRHRVVQQGFQRLRRDIPRTEPGTAGRHDQIRVGRPQPFTDLVLNMLDVISDHRAADDIGGEGRPPPPGPFPPPLPPPPPRPPPCDRPDPTPTTAS